MTVYLVGAGPGDPGLLTQRGAALMRIADVVVYDRLAHPSLLALAARTAELVDVGKSPGNVAMDQDGINATLVDRGLKGLEVVRLKGGDPFVFGRGGEEAEVLIAAGVPFEVVPGVTSAIAAAAYAGIPVTHRNVSTLVTIVTGHEDPAKGRTDVNWEALGAVGGTVVILMGAAHIRDIAERLMAGGRGGDTPVAAVRYGTRPEQQTLRTTLADAGDAGIRSPSAIVVGEVAALDFSWFEQRPLLGARIVVTRAREQASSLRERLEILGALVLELPSIRIEPLEVTLPELGGLEWIIFTSPNGVDGFFESGMDVAGLDARVFWGVKVAAIGPGTAASLAARGLRCDLLPERFVAESLLEAMPDPTGEGARVLIARAEDARDVLPEGLTARGFSVEILDVYRTVRADPDPVLLEQVRSGDVDLVTFTSGSTVKNLTEVLGGVPSPQAAVISIGPITSEVATGLGWVVTHEAAEHTIDGVIATALAAWESRA